MGWMEKMWRPEERLEKTVEEGTGLAMESSRFSRGCIKRQVNVDAEGDFSAAYTRSVEDMNAAIKLPDFKEGLRALTEKRATNFLDL